MQIKRPRAALACRWTQPEFASEDDAIEFPAFFAEAPEIILRDRLAAFLRASQTGVMTYCYADAVKLSGRSCPTVAGVGMGVMLDLDMTIAPFTREMQILLPRVMAKQVDEDEQARFAGLWQARVEQMLTQHAELRTRSSPPVDGCRMRASEAEWA